MTTAVFDHTCLHAAYKGHPFFTGLLVEASYRRGRVLVPALCAVAASRILPEAGPYALRLRSVTVEPFTAEHAAYAVAHPAVEWNVVHPAALVHAARLVGERTALVTLRPDLYEGLGLDPLNPDA